MTYDRNFYADIKAGARASAQVVVPMLCEWISPSSVIDLGCGTGDWLAVFRENGVRDVRGVDGAYVDRSMLEIPITRFNVHDLETKYETDRKFSLAMSLEVAEHLPEEAAPKLVEALVELAPVVLFSAAIPHQPGTHHVNCQWPAYWANLFEKRGYRAIDCLRPMIWDRNDVAWWYQQNLLIFLSANTLIRHPHFELYEQVSPARPLSMVHPILFEQWVEWGNSQSKLYSELADKMRTP